MLINANSHLSRFARQTGLMCALCEDDYVLVDGQCTWCPEFNWVGLVFSLVFSLAFVICMFLVCFFHFFFVLVCPAVRAV